MAFLPFPVGSSPDDWHCGRRHGKNELTKMLAALATLLTTKGVPSQNVAAAGRRLMSAPTGRAYRHGIGDAKRTEVRRLILEGVSHAKVVRRRGVSGGTVSAIRKALREEQAVLRASR